MPVTAFGSPPESSTRSEYGCRADGPAPRPRDRRAAGHLLPAAPVPTAATWPVGLHDDVADLRGEPMRAADQVAVDHEPTADPGAHPDEQQVANALTRAGLELAPRGRRVVVVCPRRDTECMGDVRRQRRVTPGQVGREPHDAGLGFDQACGGDAHRAHRRIHDGPRGLDHGGQGGSLVFGGRWSHIAGKDRAVGSSRATTRSSSRRRRYRSPVGGASVRSSVVRLRRSAAVRT